MKYFILILGILLVITCYSPSSSVVADFSSTPAKIYNITVGFHHGNQIRVHTGYNWSYSSNMLKFSRSTDGKEVFLINVDDILIEDTGRKTGTIQ